MSFKHYSIFQNFLLVLYRSEDMALPLYDESTINAPVNHSNVFNAMIHPLTRITIYGAIWYQGTHQGVRMRMRVRMRKKQTI